MNTQPLEETRESLGELIRTCSRLVYSEHGANKTDKERLEKAKSVLSKYSTMDKSQIPIQSIAPIDKTLSAEEYIRRLYPLSDKFSRLGCEKIAESYANLRVEQAKEEWSKREAIDVK